MNIRVTPLDTQPVNGAEIEIVERKGLGHPDTICDALAEKLSAELCKFYYEKFGFVLHHNVDKNLLVGGSAIPKFMGGEVTEPIEIFLSGRAIKEYKGVKIPVEELAVESAKKWLRENIHAIDPEKDVRIYTYIRPGSVDLVDIYMRQLKEGVPLSNDTSFGVGYAPFDEVENVVYHIEKKLNSKELKKIHPELGEDIKVMGVRIGETIKVTIACAFVDRYIKDINDYVEKRENVRKIAYDVATKFTNREVQIYVNTGDDIENQNVYITVTGTSAEAGDDGEVGRGNRVNGLITPYRPMSLEAAAGKNPITHVGKLYNITANEIAKAVIENIPEIEEAYCYMVSQIGKPVNEPLAVDVKIRTSEKPESFQSRIDTIVKDCLSEMKNTWKKLVEEEITVY
ncbi:Methionine adenosyltransferase [Desulfurobacterium thermolithotrophum DSM 11699]|uniref:Methionine adenosyltransferase n=1 Tax=Desulfurobacterium thermolithotrophum (strain DSM 11699 / BSA) TaxID=868864 RepID=F0S3M2_DESTD|nr:methionine adenosyltransferase [Desulfurobacterium thermolithotrophum]ADY73444.1 Methionine adenosyltransferase [Desulfurobacterium thermolithotrophum DSM 11699]